MNEQTHAEVEQEIAHRPAPADEERRNADDERLRMRRAIVFADVPNTESSVERQSAAINYLRMELRTGAERSR